MDLMNKLLFLQLCRFGIIGVAAAIVHFSVVVSLVELYSLNPLIANFFAFLVSFQVSYAGHRYWTFRGTQAQHRVALPKLLLLQSGGFVANEGLFYFFMQYMHLPYTAALILVLAILPLITFTFTKLWIFR